MSLRFGKVVNDFTLSLQTAFFPAHTHTSTKAFYFKIKIKSDVIQYFFSKIQKQLYFKVSLATTYYLAMKHEPKGQRAQKSKT